MRNNNPTILVALQDWNAASAGCRVSHYLAALFKAADIPVATTMLDFYNPTIPVRSKAEPDDIGLFIDFIRGNPFEARRIARYFCFYPTCFYGGSRVPVNEACFIYDKLFLEETRKICDYPLTEKNIIQIPNLDTAWCFSEKKVIDSVWYGSYPGKRGYREHPPFEADWKIIPDAISPQENAPHISDRTVGHNRTLAILRRAKKFFTCDPYTAMTAEAALCGCEVLYCFPDGNTKNILEESLKWASLLRMDPPRDIVLAETFAERIYEFFRE